MLRARFNCSGARCYLAFGVLASLRPSVFVVFRMPDRGSTEVTEVSSRMQSSLFGYRVSS